MKRAYVALLLKEFRRGKLRIAMVSAGLVFLNALLYMLALRGWPATALGIIQIGILFLLALWWGYERMQEEWLGGQAQLLLTLPVPGWYITSTKNLVALGEIVFYAAIALVSTIILALPSGQAFLISGQHVEPGYALTSGALWGAFGWLMLNYAFIFLILLSATQAAFVIGRMAPRRRGWVALFGGGLFFWFVDRVAAIVAPAFGWLPEFYGGTSLMVESSSGGLVTSNYISIGLNQVAGAEIMGLLIGLALVQFVVGRLFERRVQV